MKITDVESFLMSYPMPEPLKLPFWGGERTIIKRDAMLIRISTDTGLAGYAPGPAHERARREINSEIRSFLTGKDPRHWKSFRFESNPETIKTYRATEIALLDLVGRYEACAVCELLGGRVRDRIKLYGSAGMYMSPQKYAEEAAAIAAMGFDAYKMRPGIGLEEDLQTVELMRRAVGPQIGLMIDAHTWWRMGERSYSAEQIEQLADDLAAYNPLWLEEPLPPEKHDAYRTLRGRLRVKLASGEHEPDVEGFLDLMDSQAVDYVQMDVLCQGGFAVAQKIFDHVQRHGLKFAFHSWGTNLEVLAAAHVGICRPEEVVEWLEYPCYSNEGRAGMYPFALSDEILTERLEIERGYLVVPDGPGLGIDVDERVIEKYPFIPGPWSIFRLDNPAETIAVTGDHSIKWVKGQ
ncbi:MAG: mandelate racemase/muconate lactonizing enzyme family protein [Phycisphaerales bacterium]|nr:MAG: mandelate racemase/muconate lactonizing enzyme family protein [Phycisphaerales bacterium]